MRHALLRHTLMIYIVFLFFTLIDLPNQGGTSVITAPVFYVSKSGTDLGDGSKDNPWLTIQHALDSVDKGGIIYISSGIYNEKLVLTHSGTEDQPLVLSAGPSAKPIIDGTNLKGESLIDIDSLHDIVIQGFELRNNKQQAYAAGIYVYGSASNIDIMNNTLHDIGTNANQNEYANGGANAIQIEGTHPTQALHDIRIEGNLIYDCVLGRSEALTVSKNVDRFLVKNNTVHDVTNIGIDIAGHHGSFKGNPELNQARNGHVVGNTVYHARSLYGTRDASGLYIDGAKNIIVENNRIYECDYGLTVGCENLGKTASQITVSQNLVYNNDKSGISIGGYRENVGRVTDSDVYSNLAYKNNRLGIAFHSELNLKLTEGTLRIFNNIFYSRQTAPVNFSTKQTSYFPILYNLKADAGIQLNNNIWYADLPAKSLYFRWHDKPYIGFQSYMLATKQDTSSIAQKPLFINAAKGDFTPAANSPVINAGQNKRLNSSQDLAGNPRIENKIVDIGPLESQLSYGIMTIDGNPKDWLGDLNTSPYFWAQRFTPQLSSFQDPRNLYFGGFDLPASTKVQLYLDIDPNSTTGYTPYYWTSFHADFLIENGILYQYAGNNNQWSWQRIGPVPFEKKDNFLELSLLKTQLGITAPAFIEFGFYTAGGTKNFIPEKGAKPLSLPFH